MCKLYFPFDSSTITSRTLGFVLEKCQVRNLSEKISNETFLQQKQTSLFGTTFCSKTVGFSYSAIIVTQADSPVQRTFLLSRLAKVQLA